MLRGLRVLPGHSRANHPASLSTQRRRIFCHSHHSRTRPFAASTCSAAAHLTELGSVGSSGSRRAREMKFNRRIL